ncbi:MAG: winged helix-turn-helix domain-containing protein [Cyanobium sp.]
MTPAGRVLLVGEKAEALAARLEASGYTVVLGSGGLGDGEVDGAGTVDVAVLAAEAAGEIQALRQRLGPPPILLDGTEDSLAARVRCLSAGADDFWLSALGPSDLLMRLRLHLSLQRQAAAPTNLLQVADLSLDPVSRSVKRGPRLVDLTAREYQLLLLLERQGTVVSRELILRRVWNDDRRTSSNVIEVYVRYLRQKLEEGGERRLIHTVRGQGYCLGERQPPLGARP